MAVRPGDRSRREFMAAAAAALVAARAGRLRGAALTADEAVQRIRAGVGVPWRDTTVDAFKAGDPRTIVTGVATTVSATLPLLRKAADAGRNLIVTCEPTFYNGNDEPGARATDPVYLAKKAFIDERRLVVWRFSDHWGARIPNEFTTALAAALGWARRRAADNPSVYEIPPTTMAALRTHVQTRLALRGGMRVVGNPALRIRRVLISPGTTDLASTVRDLPQADVVLSGEPREWEAVEYVLDTAAAGKARGMIAIGRSVSQEPGMQACATWLRTVIPEVPVDAFPAGDPYWRPA
jgi:putative NIF3 family GTP cyclohydrolase 1 type 2